MERGLIKGILIGGIVFGSLAIGMAKLITSIDQSAQDGDIITAAAWNDLVANLGSGGGESGGGETISVCDSMGQTDCQTSTINNMISWTCQEGYSWSNIEKNCILPVNKAISTLGEGIQSSMHASYAASLTFDGNDGTFGHTENENPAYIGFAFNDPQIITSYKYLMGLNVHYIQAYKFQGSNTGAWSGEEVTLDDVDLGTQEIPGQTRSINNTTAYKYYRMIVTRTSYTSGNYLSIATMELY